MANKLKAVNAYRARIDAGNTVQKDELARYLASRTGLNRSEIAMVLTELRDAIVFYGLSGRGVKLEDLGTYLPNLKTDGTFDLSYRLDRSLRRELNADNAFTGKIINRENLGKSTEEFVAMWNEDNPNDLVV